jgi:hypothetical protein
LNNPITNRQELSRFPLQRRPVADPGTTLVFQTRRGELISAQDAFTAGEVFWRGYRMAYTVDVRPHGASFTCQLPAKGDALGFAASVSYNWAVHDATTVVRDEVRDAAESCREYLIKEMRRVSRRVDAIAGDAAERAERLIETELGQTAIRLANGLSITALHAALSLDQDQADLIRRLAMGTLTSRLDIAAAHSVNDVEKIRQAGELHLRHERIMFYEQLTGGNRLVAGILAEDPTKAAETFQLMASMEQQKRGEAIRAMEVIIKGGHLQIGDLAAGSRRAAARRAGPGRPGNGVVSFLDQLAYWVREVLAFGSPDFVAGAWFPVLVVVLFIAMMLTVRKLVPLAAHGAAALLNGAYTVIGLVLLVPDALVASAWRRMRRPPPALVYHYGDAVVATSAGVTRTSEAVASRLARMARMHWLLVILICGALIWTWNHSHCPADTPARAVCVRPFTSWIDSFGDQGSTSPAHSGKSGRSPKRPTKATPTPARKK